MRHVRRALLVALTFPAVVLPSHPGDAATATTNIVLSVSVLQSCLVTASPLVFGNYDPTASIPKDGLTSVFVTCTPGTAYNIGLSAGTGSGASVSTRKMTSGGNTLDYGLYRDEPRTQVWGQTVGVNTVGNTATGLSQRHDVYGRITPQQTSRGGVYSDTITVTVNY